MKKFLLSIFCCLMAVFAVQAQSYVKVTSAPADWSGDYLIVYEDGNVAFNGSLTTLDAISNTISVEIVNGEIASTATTDAAKFTINGNGNILSASGYYVGQTSNANGLKSSKSTAYENTLSLNADGSVNVVSSGGAYLRYNANKDQLRFRYFKSSTYSSQKAIALYKYTETTAGEGGDTPAVPTLTNPTFTPADGATFEESMDVTIEAEDGATIYYTINGDEPSTTSAVYTVPFSITETTTVKAYAVKDGSNDSQVATATYTKVDPNAKTATFDFTVPSELTPSVTNFVSQAFNTSATTFTNNGITLNTTDGSTASRIWEGSAYELRVYKEATMTIAAPDGGVLTSIEFTGSTVNAFSANVGVLSEKVWTGSASSVVFTWSSTASTQKIQTVVVTYSIDENIVIVNQPSIAGGETFVGSTTVEITNNAAGTTLYYSTDGVDYSEYTGALTIDATTTVYAYAQDGEGNKSSVAEATFTKMEIISIADAKAAYDAASANVAVAMDITGAVVTVNSGQYMFIETAEAGINIYSSGADYAVGTKFTTGYILGESAVYGMMHQITNAEFCDVATEIVEVTPKDVTIAELNADFAAYEGRYVKLTGVDINDKTITQGEDIYALYKRFDFITPPAVAANCDIVAVVARYNTTYQVFPVSISNSVDVTAAGYATLYLGYPVAIPANVEAYVVSAVNDGWVALEQVTGVLPAETGVIVKADEDEYEFVYSADEAATINSSLLKGTVAAENVTPVGTAYVLSAPAGKVGLYKAALNCDETGAEGETHFLNNANKAYLDVTNSDPIASYSFNFDWNGTTGVEGVVAEGAQDGAIYDITGRRVKAITAPGIYIVNGRKVVK